MTINKILDYLNSLTLPDPSMECEPSKPLPENSVQLVTDGRVLPLADNWEVGPAITNESGEIVQVIVLDDVAINLNGGDTLKLTQYLLSELIKSAEHYDRTGVYSYYIKKKILNVFED